MIARGILDSERADLNGKEYTFDLDRDFLHVTIASRQVAFSDYFPRIGVPNDYVIVDFDKEGRVIGYAMEGILADWASKSFANRAKVFLIRTKINANSVSLASRVLSALGKRALADALPTTDSHGRLPAYAT